MTRSVTKRGLWLWPVLFLATHVWSQTTSVTLQITDTDVQTWNNGTWTASLYSPPGVPSNNYVISGTTTSVPNQQQSGTLNSTGAGSLTVTSNTSISPSGTQWQFTFCPQATPTQCPQYAFSITGASFNIAPTPPGVRVSVQNPQIHALAYLDLEITGAVLGSQYYNIGILVGTRVCTAATSTGCTTWTGITTAYSFFGNTANPLTALIDPTTIIDAVGNSILFLSAGIIITDHFGDNIVVANNQSGSADSAGDFYLLGGGTNNWQIDNGSGSASITNPVAGGGGVINFHDSSVTSDGPFTGSYVVNGHVNQATADTYFAGKCVFISTTCSIGYSTPFNSIPVVVITPLNPGAIIFTLTTSTVTGFTITASISATNVVDWIAIGYPN